MQPFEPIGGGTAPSQIHDASSRQRCGHVDNASALPTCPQQQQQKKTAVRNWSKLVQNHPHDFTKKQFFKRKFSLIAPAYFEYGSTQHRSQQDIPLMKE